MSFIINILPSLEQSTQPMWFLCTDRVCLLQVDEARIISYYWSYKWITWHITPVMWPYLTLTSLHTVDDLTSLHSMYKYHQIKPLNCNNITVITGLDCTFAVFEIRPVLRTMNDWLKFLRTEQSFYYLFQSKFVLPDFQTSQFEATFSLFIMVRSDWC